MTLPATTLASTAATRDPIRVLVVDDSVVIRGLLGRWIGEAEGMVSVGAARNGRQGVEMVEALKPDVVILDIEMPEMDGIAALPEMLRISPRLIVIMASTLTQRNAEISLKALSLGAKDYIPKPESQAGISTSAEFRRALIEKISQLGGLRRPVRPTLRSLAAGTRLRQGDELPASTRVFSRMMPRVLAIGSSTGGPPALVKFFSDLGPALQRLPVVVVQHMPATFTPIFAQHLQKAAGIPAAEGIHGEPLQPGRIYVAPGGKHMVVAGSSSAPVIELNSSAPIHFCRPAVDPMFASIASLYGTSALAVVFTGMGSDGAEGGVRIADAGGSVIAQDEATSVVWGMPGATVQAGAAAAVLPLDEIAPKVRSLLAGRRA
ncbi:MAG: chemotaxis response regulator protein-glutamate methylesterase [Rhodobiaceae bacterium]|nr:chemotaxis response regulator protein-glutamate methylesterase [Rhodobiaceae bacterium]MCC0057440.1 chemotaxis response regulator protein-glutamate methylesterase [Rhodobiaceae bacterium]